MPARRRHRGAACGSERQRAHVAGDRLAEFDHGHRVVARPVVARDRVEVAGAGDVARRRVAVLQFDQREPDRLAGCVELARQRGIVDARAVLRELVGREARRMSGTSSNARSAVSTGASTGSRVGRPRCQPNSAR